MGDAERGGPQPGPREPSAPATDPDEVAGRRRLIDLAMTRRPGLSVGEVDDILRRLGMAVPWETVVADLDALGYEVEDGDRVALAVDPVPTGTDGPAGPAEERRGSSRLVPVLVAVSVVIALVAAVFAVVGLVQGDDTATQVDRAAEDRPSFEATPATDAGGDAPGDEAEGTGEQPPDAPPAPADVEVDFAGEGGLPDAGDLGAWVPGRGGWFLADGTARVDAPGQEEAITYLRASGPDVTAEIALPEASPGAGVAVRVADDGDYLAWTLTSDGTGVQLVRVTDARQTVLLTPGDLPTPIAPGVRLGVRAAGADLDLLVDGAVVASATDDGPLDPVGVGLVALGTDQVPVFDDLRLTFA